MKPAKTRPVIRFSLLGAALFLGACNTTDPGVDEFRDTRVDAQVAGRTLAGGFAQGQDWNAAVTAPAAPSLGFSAPTALLKRSSALPKRSAAVDIRIDLADTAKGFATLTIESELPLGGEAHDTITVRWDAQARDEEKDNENIIRYKRVQTHALGRTETLVITDADGDGLVTPVAGAGSLARFVFTTSDAGVVETAELVVGSGPDGDFDAEGDNTVKTAVWTRTKAGALLAKGEFLDADGDGLVGDNAKDAVTLAKWFEMEPKDKPWVKKQTAEAKIRVFAAKAGDEPVSFAFTEELKGGRVNALSIRNRLGGTDIVKGDTLWVKLETTKAAGDDTLRHAEIVFVMNPGQDLKSEDDDLCYAFHVKTEKKLGFERSAEFHFVAGEPVPHGEEPASGTFSGKATYANGQSATLEGSFSPEGFTAEFTGPEGNTVSVAFSRAGDVI